MLPAANWVWCSVPVSCAMLQVADGISTVLNFEQLRPLINRLNSGQPINVVAFGDSVTASFGECLPSDSEGQTDLLHHRCNRWACGIGGHLALCAQTFAGWPCSQASIATTSQQFEGEQTDVCWEALRGSPWVGGLPCRVD